MMILDTINRSLRVVLAGAVATTQADVLASFVDLDLAAVPPAFAPAANVAVTNGVTPVSIVPAPAANTQRQTKFVSICNRDMAAMTATVQYLDTATVYEIVTVTLQPGSTLQYTDGVGWRVTTAAGILLSGAPAGWLLYNRVVFTNAQVLALPTTPLTVLPTVAGSLIVPLKIMAQWNTIAGIYTNIDAAGYLAFEVNSITFSDFLGNDATTTPALTDLTTALGTASNPPWSFDAFRSTVDPASAGWGAGPEEVSAAAGPLQLFCNNGGSGNLTGGNAANSLTVDVWYVLRAV